MKNTNLITVKGYTKKEMIGILGLPSIKVFNRKILPYLELIGPKVGKYYECWQVEIMISLFGTIKFIDPDETDSIDRRNSTIEKMIDQHEKNEGKKKREP